MLTTRAARALRRQLPLRAGPDGTVRWHTHGLEDAVRERREGRRLPDRRLPPPALQERVERIGGLIAISASPGALRAHAVIVHQLGDHRWRGMDYAEIDGHNGEVQVLRDYQRGVSTARRAREEVLAELADPPTSDRVEPLIWRRGTEVRHQRRVPRRQRRSVGDPPTGRWH